MTNDDLKRFYNVNDKPEQNKDFVRYGSNGEIISEHDATKDEEVVNYRTLMQHASGGLQEVTASDVNSEQATNGQVLTANGNGGASWQTSTGGGDKLYIHTIAFGSTPSPGSTPYPYYCKIYSKRQAVFSSMAELGQYLYEKNEIVLTTWKYGFVAKSAYYSYPLAIRGTKDSSNDYFEFLNGQRLDFAINDGSIKITSGAPALWFAGSVLGHGYFEDNVSEL